MSVNLQKPERLVVVGSVGFDHIMGMGSTFSDFIMPDMIDKLNVSFTVDSFQKEFGGTGGNCCYGLGLMGTSSYLISTFGSDSESYQKHLKNVGVNLKLAKVSKSSLSAQGFVVSDGVQNQIWGYYPGAMNENIELDLGKITKETDLVALLPSDPDSYEKFVSEMVELKRNFVFDPAFFVANLSKKTLLNGVLNAKLVFGNEYEIELMQRKTKTKLEEWLESGVIVVTTKGVDGSVVEAGSDKEVVPAIKELNVMDPTGAGDAYRAGFLAGIMQGESLDKCAKMGSVLASFGLENVGTQSYSFSSEEFLKRLNKNY